MAVWVSESEPAVEWYGNSLVGAKVEKNAHLMLDYCLHVVTVTILPYTPFEHALVTGLDIHLLATHCFLNVNSLTLS